MKCRLLASNKGKQVINLLVLIIHFVYRCNIIVMTK